MKIGNRHLQHKLSAMTEAAQKEDSPNSSPSSPKMNGKRVVINLDMFKEATTLQQTQNKVHLSMLIMHGGECIIDLKRVSDLDDDDEQEEYIDDNSY